jgi:N-acetylmuramoyl-L-alanine amidase
MPRASCISATPSEGDPSFATHCNDSDYGPGKLKNFNQSQRRVRWSAVLLLGALSALPAAANSHRSEAWAQAHFDAAEQMRQTLQERPAKKRTRHEYQLVIDAYRRVYYGSPVSTKADPSVVAVADLMVGMGRQFNDEAILRKAIRQYEFLRREYPGSKSRFEALFNIGEIYKNDLDDPAHAKAAFEEFLRRYPRYHLAEDVKKELAELDQPQPAEAKDEQGSSGKAASSDQTDQTDQTAKKDDKTAGAGASAQEGELVEVTRIRHWITPDYTRISIDLGKEVKFDAQRLDHPDRIFCDLFSTKLPASLAGKTLDGDDGFLKNIRVAEFEPGRTRVVLDVDGVDDYKASMLSNPPRLIIDIYGKGPDTTAVKASVKKTIVEADDDDDDDASSAKGSTHKSRARVSGVTPASERSRTETAKNAHEAKPTASGDRSLIRALGLKIGKIVIDPGHGGHDTGTIGPDGLEEKDLVLDVSKRLGKLLEARLGAEVDYTRTDDTFVPLETRTAIANQDHADLFISIHANSSRDPDARGVETYYLNFTSSSDALEVAARENASSDKSIYELQDLVKKIALKEKIEESREFASDVENSLYSGLAQRSPGIRDRGVKKAPFIVLIGANMPSILAEISFVSNPTDEHKLRTSAYRQRIAESLYRGISKYASGLSGVKVASEVSKGTGQ